MPILAILVVLLVATLIWVLTMGNPFSKKDLKTLSKGAFCIAFAVVIVAFVSLLINNLQGL